MGIADGCGLAVLLLVALLDSQAQGQRAVIHADAVLVQCPDALAQAHGEIELHLVAVLPLVSQAKQTFLHLAVDGLAIDFHVSPRRPRGNTQIEGETQGGVLLQTTDGDQDVLAEGIMGCLVEDDLLSVCHLHACLTIRICQHGSATIGTCQHQILSVVGPSHRVVVLTATAAEGIHAEEGTAIVHARSMVVAVGLYHVGASQVAQRTQVLCHRGRIAVEGHILEVLYPLQVARHRHQYLIGKHLLHEAAGLCALTWVDVSVARILVGSKHAARHLPIDAANQVVVVVGCPQRLLVA